MSCSSKMSTTFCKCSMQSSMHLSWKMQGSSMDWHTKSSAGRRCLDSLPLMLKVGYAEWGCLGSVNIFNLRLVNLVLLSSVLYASCRFPHSTSSLSWADFFVCHAHRSSRDNGTLIPINEHGCPPQTWCVVHHLCRIWSTPLVWHERAGWSCKDLPKPAHVSPWQTPGCQSLCSWNTSPCCKGQRCNHTQHMGGCCTSEASQVNWLATLHHLV